VAAFFVGSVNGQGEGYKGRREGDRAYFEALARRVQKRMIARAAEVAVRRAYKRRLTGV